jgi:hypothetical protein
MAGDVTIDVASGDRIKLDMALMVLEPLGPQIHRIEIIDSCVRLGRRRRVGAPDIEYAADAVGKTLAKALDCHEICALEHLELQGLALSPRLLVRLIQCLPRCPRLHTLHFEFVTLIPPVFEQLMDMMCNLSVSRVRFIGCCLLPRCNESIAKLLRRQGERRDALTWESGLRGSAASVRGAGLVSLVLARNFLGDSFVEIVGPTIERDVYLAELDVRRNCIGRDSIRSLLRTLKGNRSMLLLQVAPQNCLQSDQRMLYEWSAPMMKGLSIPRSVCDHVQEIEPKYSNKLREKMTKRQSRNAAATAHFIGTAFSVEMQDSVHSPRAKQRRRSNSSGRSASASMKKAAKTKSKTSRQQQQTTNKPSLRTKKKTARRAKSAVSSPQHAHHRHQQQVLENSSNSPVLTDTDVTAMLFRMVADMQTQMDEQEDAFDRLVGVVEDIQNDVIEVREQQEQIVKEQRQQQQQQQSGMFSQDSEQLQQLFKYMESNFSQLMATMDDLEQKFDGAPIMRTSDSTNEPTHSRTHEHNNIDEVHNKRPKLVATPSMHDLTIEEADDHQ